MTIRQNFINDTGSSNSNLNESIFYIHHTNNIMHKILVRYGTVITLLLHRYFIFFFFSFRCFSFLGGVGRVFTEHLHRRSGGKCNRLGVKLFRACYFILALFFPLNKYKPHRRERKNDIFSISRIKKALSGITKG